MCGICVNMQILSASEMLGQGTYDETKFCWPMCDNWKPKTTVWSYGCWQCENFLANLTIPLSCRIIMYCILFLSMTIAFWLWTTSMDASQQWCMVKLGLKTITMLPLSSTVEEMLLLWLGKMIHHLWTTNLKRSSLQTIVVTTMACWEEPTPSYMSIPPLLPMASPSSIALQPPTFRYSVVPKTTSLCCQLW